MISAYFTRITILCVACFFLVNAGLGILAWFMSRAAIRRAGRMAPRPAERMIFALRIFPSAGAAFAVLALCVPSYLRLEPASSVERIGIPCCVAALAGLAAWAIAARRVGRAMLWREAWSANGLRSARGAVRVIESDAPVLALAGLFRRRVILSRAVLNALSAEQLDMALRHERAHGRSFDNWKRLLLLGPAIMPFSRALEPLDRAWAIFAEWAADDEAADGDAGLAVTLAETLLRFARIGSAPKMSPLLAPLVRGDEDLAARVSRLLDVREAPRFSRTGWRARSRSGLAAAAACLACASLGALAALPGTMATVHEMLERLVR